MECTVNSMYLYFCELTWIFRTPYNDAKVTLYGFINGRPSCFVYYLNTGKIHLRGGYIYSDLYFSDTRFKLSVNKRRTGIRRSSELHGDRAKMPILEFAYGKSFTCSNVPIKTNHINYNIRDEIHVTRRELLQ